jgi:hypothetical protein
MSGWEWKEKKPTFQNDVFHVKGTHFLTKKWKINQIIVEIVSRIRYNQKTGVRM